MKVRLDGRIGLLLALLAVLLVWQVVPFRFFYPSTVPLGEVSSRYHAGFLVAEQYHRARELAGLAKRLTVFPALLLLLVSGVALGVERRCGEGRWRWPARLLFLAAACLLFNVLGMPYKICLFLERQELALTALTFAEWGRLFLISSVLPITVFVLRNLLIYCTMPLFGRWWWMAAALMVLVIFSWLPEWLSRTRPITLVEQFEPLAEGPLRDALVAVAAPAGFDLEYYSVDQSKRGREVNMYVTGRVGREYVVLTDTVKQRLTPRQASAMLAHELSHQENRRQRVLIVKALSLVGVLASFFLASRFAGGGAVTPRRRLHALLQYWLATHIIGLAMMPVGASLSRYEERKADTYALALRTPPQDLESVILRTSRINLAPYDIPPWAYWLASSHPTVRQRLEFVRRAQDR